jgi:hypothetical protein
VLADAFAGGQVPRPEGGLAELPQGQARTSHGADPQGRCAELPFGHFLQGPGRLGLAVAAEGEAHRDETDQDVDHRERGEAEPRDHIESAGIGRLLDGIGGPAHQPLLVGTAVRGHPSSRCHPELLPSSGRTLRWLLQDRSIGDAGVRRRTFYAAQDSCTSLRRQRP